VVYPSDFEAKIGFDQIRQMLKAECICSLGEKNVDAIVFTDNFEIIISNLRQTDNFRQLHLFENEFHFGNYYDLNDELARITVEGTFIETEGLFRLKKSLSVINDIKEFFTKRLEDNKYPYLNELSEKIYLDKAILKSISKIIDDTGIMRDDASDVLKRISMELKNKHASINKKLQLILAAAKKDTIVSDDAELTVRNGRLVIPILSAYKRKIKGFIHDESASGNTVFIEPEAIFNLNNEIRELEIARNREIIKILLKMADFLRLHIADLQNCFYYLGLFDFIRAKAKFAIRIDGCLPLLNKNPMIHWQKAKHPLLFLSHKAQNKTIEPLDITLDNDKRILVISGPNAGGKSVCLKTVGLIQYMIQVGLLPPLLETSEAGIFETLMIDIGDQQSIENDMSTYSSHLTNMNYFLNHANQKTLFLIDEFGSGTEPILGGAIAEVILEELNEKNAFGVITTHYANLKLMADNSKGIINAAMLFDSDKMLPLYKLNIGKPGSSFAFEIADNIGFEKNLLQRAEKKTGSQIMNFDKQLKKTEVLKADYEKKLAELKITDHILLELIEKNKLLADETELNKNIIINDAKTEALKILDETNKLIEKTIREIKESKADKENTILLRKNLKAYKEKIIIDKTLPKFESAKEKKLKSKHKDTTLQNNPEILNTQINNGDKVRIKGQNQLGEVKSIKDDRAVVMFGYVSLIIPVVKLEKVKLSHSNIQTDDISKTKWMNIQEKFSKFKTTLDIRGLKAEEALGAIRQYIDDAVLLDIHEVNIIHGKGDGVLRKVVRDYIKNILEIVSYKDEHADRGGDGVTIIGFR